MLLENYAFKTVWPRGLRRWLQALVRKGVGSNPTAVIKGSLAEQAPYGDRTHDHTLTKRMLYQLS